MGASFITIFAWLYFLIIFALWAYFFIHSYQHSVSPPWGFSIVIAGVFVSGYGYTFYVTQVGLISINLLFLVSLFGILWNIENIREQFHIRKTRDFLRFLGIGLIIGLLFGISQMVLLGTEYFRINPGFSTIALIASIIQISVAEEILNRGYFLSYLRRYGFNPTCAIVFQSLMFTAMHVSRYSDDWLALCSILFMGIVAGYITWKSNNLMPAIALHTVINLIGIVWWLVVV